MTFYQGWLLIGVVLLFAGQHAKSIGRNDAGVPWFLGAASVFAGMCIAVYS